MSDVIIAGATYPDVPAVDLNKSSGGIARYYEPSEILYAASSTSGGSAIYANGIHYAQVDATSTATVFTATIDGITEYYDGLTIILKNGIITSESGFTININNLGAKPCYSSMATATRETTIFNINYTMMFVYDSSRVSGGCWVCYHGYNALSNATPAALGTASAGSSSETARADHVHEKPTYTASDVGAIPAPASASSDNVLAYNGSAWVADKRTVILSYGHSTWAEFLSAYHANAVIYCRASSSANPATGSQTRMAFMAYVSNADNPTNVEFQYYRSVSSHSAAQQGDQVYVYKLDKNAGWSVIVRENYTKIVAGTGLSSSYSSGTLTLSNSQTALPTVSSSDKDKYLHTNSSTGALEWSSVASGDDIFICDVTRDVTQVEYNYYASSMTGTEIKTAINSGKKVILAFNFSPNEPRYIGSCFCLDNGGNLKASVLYVTDSQDMVAAFVTIDDSGNVTVTRHGMVITWDWNE